MHLEGAGASVMKRLAVLLGFALFLLLPTSVAAAECQFFLGFKTLRDLIGHEIVGECLESEHHGDNGDGLQQTTGGLMAWRKADNWTAFTEGYRTWINGPNGLEQRLNSEFLPWEALQAKDSLPWVRDGIESFYEHDSVRRLQVMLERSPQVYWELMHKSWIQSDSLHVNLTFLPMLFRHINSVAHKDEALALRVLQMPFMDTLGFGVEAAWTTLLDILASDPGGLHALLSHPTLRDGITIDHIALLPVLYLLQSDPESAAALGALSSLHEIPWDVDDLRRLAQASQPVFWAWMDSHGERKHGGSIIERIITLAPIDEQATIQIVRMPFLKTEDDGIDLEIVEFLARLARSDPAILRQTLSLPEFREGITDDHAATLALLELGRRDPEAAKTIGALPWVQDGVGRPVGSVIRSDSPDPSVFEQGALLDHVKLASDSPLAFTELLSFPWIRTL